MIALMTITMSPLLFGMKENAFYYLSKPTIIQFNDEKCVLCGTHPYLVLFKGKPDQKTSFVDFVDPNTINKLDLIGTSLLPGTTFIVPKPKKNCIRITEGYSNKQLKDLSNTKLTKKKYFEMFFKQQNTENLENETKHCCNFPFPAGK